MLVCFSCVVSTNVFIHMLIYEIHVYVLYCSKENQPPPPPKQYASHTTSFEWVYFMQPIIFAISFMYGFYHVNTVFAVTEAIRQPALYYPVHSV